MESVEDMKLKSALASARSGGISYREADNDVDEGSKQTHRDNLQAMDPAASMAGLNGKTPQEDVRKKKERA
jgi:hypothetical protein